MGLYQNDSGVLTPIAGRGKAEYGASTVRKGTVSFSVAGNDNATQQVIFNTPMPDADYLVDYSLPSDFLSKQIINVEQKTANGFILYDTNVANVPVSFTVEYTAYKLYTDNEYNKILNGQQYSTDEVDTGKTWINGKKIYRRVVNCGAGPAAGATKTISHNIANIERFTHLEMIGDNNTNYWTIPWFDNNRKWWWYANRTTIYIISGASSDATTYNHLAILEYTKTT